MVKVTLRDDVREYEAGTTAYEIARSISAGLAREACAARIDGEPCDLRTPIEKDCAVEILTFDDPYGKKAFWHTTSHVMAQAVLHLFPKAKFSIGPAVDSGFYYDFDVDRPFTADDLAQIEEEMAEIIKTGLEVRKFCMTVEEARGFMKDQPYKLELIEEHAGKGEALSFYQQGDFTELCAGPHLMSIAQIKAFKLTSTTGAYWRGNEKNKMLSRIYGISYPKKAELEAYLAAVEDAKRRDHNVLGRQLKYFCNSDYIGQGLPCLMPKGAKLFQILNRYIQDKEEYEYGYVMTRTPLMAKSDLYKVSGHWDHYKENMFVLGDEEKDKEVYALRPMTCPFQYQVYLSEKHSYRDLPIRYGETSTLFRNEASGEMHGLIRVRQFTITEGHLIVRPDQLEQEFAGCVRLIKEVMTDVGLIGDLSFRFSRWDPDNREKYEGTPEMWEETETTMRGILNDLHIPYVEAKGEAAFYGPKLDVQAKNVYGKEDTIVTVQIDMMLAQRFGMTYTDQNNQQINPYIIHRTSLGCYERTIALLIEKYAGALPLWLSPEQVRVMPITEDQNDYAEEVRKQLAKAGFRAAGDLRFERIGFKIHEAQVEKIPYMVVVGAKEKESGTVTVRDRRDGGQTACTLEEFIAKLRAENDNRVCF